MENWQKHYIHSKLDKLVELTRIDPILCAHLDSKNLLSKSDHQLLKVTKRNIGETEQRKELYNILTTKPNSYDLLIKCLEDAKQTGAANELRKPISPVIFNVNNPSSKFFGRTQELLDLHQIFTCSVLSEGRRLHSNLTCIVGMGGIGKTELVRMFCKNYLKTSTNVHNIIWINGETDMSITSSFTKLATVLNIPIKTATGQERDTISIATDIFSSLPNYPLTIIYDNVDKIEVLLEGKYLDIKALYSMKFRPNILVTSRATNWNKILGDKFTFTLDVMTPEEATNWVASRLQNINKSSESNARLVSTLDCYPLALQQAISYIEHRNETSSYSVDNYLLDFHETKSKLKIMNSEYFNCEYGNEYRYTTFTTFFTSIECILEDENGFLAFEYLSICAYLNPDDIAETLFPVHDKTSDKHDKALKLLTKFSLLRLNSTKHYTVHRVLQEVIRCYLHIRETKLHTAVAVKEKLRKLNTSKTGIFKEFSILEKILSTMQLNDETHHAAYLWTYVPNYTELVKRYYSTATFGSYKWTPLHILSDAGNISALKSLIQGLKCAFSGKLFQSFIDKGDECCRTAVFLAAASGHARVIEMLHQNNASLYIESSICYVSLEKLNRPGYYISKFTAMHMAVYNGHKNAVCMLNSIDPKLAVIPDRLSNTAITIAVKLADNEIVKSLKSHSITDEIGVIITQIAKGILSLEDLKGFLAEQNQSMIKKILETKLSGGRLSLLELAISAHVHTDVLDFLVSKGVDLNVESYGIDYQLLGAARNNDLDTFKWICQQSLNIYGFVFVNYGWNPLGEAARFGSLDIVKFIIPETGNNGISGLDIHINTQDSKGDTALYSAAYRGKMNVVDFLIKRGAEINRYNKWGSTPIIAAALKAKFNVVKYLAKCHETIFQPCMYDVEKRTLLGMLNLTFVHASVAYDLVSETEILLDIIKQRDESLFLKIMSGGWSFNNEIISLLHIAVFFDCPNILEHFVRNYSEQMRFHCTISCYDIINVFYRCSQNGTFYFPRRVKSAMALILKVMRLFPNDTFRLTPFRLAKIMGSTRCMNVLQNIENDYEFGWVTKGILAMIIPKIKFYQLAAKQYLNANIRSDVALGELGMDLVQRAFLGWDLTPDY